MVVPNFVIIICGISSLISITISIVNILLQLVNYRKVFEQRLIVRIQSMVPLYAITCFISLYTPQYSKYVEPIREIYEAFILYTFFNLLTVMLGGERNILHFTSGRPPVGKIDISDPYHFLYLKKGVLQYVYWKPILCILVAMSQLLGLYDVNDISITSVYLWLGIIYNLSVTISLYCLALFWKCLYTDLKKFNPWGKFLCVKLIIFASYWQGVILALVNYAGILPGGTTDDDENNTGLMIQNALLCVELIFFSIGHWFAFDYKNFNKQTLPNCGKLKPWAAFKDCTGVVDLWMDFKTTSNNEFWSYRHFDSVENLIAEERSKIKRINQGMRYSHGGTQKYWLPRETAATVGRNNNTPVIADDDENEINEDDELLMISPDQDHLDDKDELLYNYAKRHYPFGDVNYPVQIEIDSYMYSKNFQNMRSTAALKYGAGARQQQQQHEQQDYGSTHDY